MVAALALVNAAQAAPAILRLDGTSLPVARAAAIADAELKADHVMGAQIAILDHGHVVWTHAYGLRDAKQNLLMTVDTNIWAASITKAVFATFVVHLVETHRLDLDEPITHMLSKPLDQYADYKDRASDLVRDSRWARVTPRMVLSHSSGLANFAGLTRHIIAVPIPEQDNAMPPERVADAVRVLGMRVEVVDGIEAALRSIARLAYEVPPRILITGSLYLAGHVLAINGTPPT